MDQCSFSVQSEWRRLERSILQPQRIKPTLYGLSHFGYEKPPGGYTNFRTQLRCPSLLRGPYCPPLSENREIVGKSSENHRKIIGTSSENRACAQKPVHVLNNP